MGTFKSEKLQTTEIPPLLFAPLLEAIFEIRWELVPVNEQQGLMRDPSYPMMYGRLYDRLQKEYPIIEDLPTTQAHPDANPYLVRHRLRKEEGGYPLMQVGPGVITLNEIKGYDWKAFQASILRVVESVIELYPANAPRPLNFIKCELRYMNGIRFDEENENPLEFLQEKLHLRVEPTEPLFPLTPHSVNFNFVYPIEEPVGHMAIGASLGKLENKTAYLLQLALQSLGETCPVDKASLKEWLEQAHEVLKHCFSSLCKGRLMERFCGGKR